MRGWRRAALCRARWGPFYSCVCVVCSCVRVCVCACARVRVSACVPVCDASGGAELTINLAGLRLPSVCYVSAWA